MYMLLCVGVHVHAQLNIPAHFSYVEQGFYEQPVFDEDTNTTRLLYSEEIPPFYLYSFEVSVQEYKRFCDTTNRQMPPQPEWGFNDLKLPVVNVTYVDALDYCHWLSTVYGMQFRLPTKIEWEHAARNGVYESNEYSYAAKTPNAFVNYADNTNNKPKCVSCIQPNEIGLYNMCGNVWEWTQQQRQGATARVVGGSFLDDSTQVKVTSQKELNTSHRSETVGFRVLVEAKDMKHYLFLEKAQTLLNNAFNNKPPIEFTKEGIVYKDRFVPWEDAYKNVSIARDAAYIEFCCGVKDRKNTNTKSAKAFRITFDKENRKQIDAMMVHLKSFNEL